VRVRRAREPRPPARRRPAELRAVVCGGRRGLELRPHPDDGSFRAPLREPGGLRPGDIVAVRFEARGRVRPGRKLGRVGDPELDFAGLCDAHGLPRSFPPRCLRESERPRPAGGAAARLDLRDLAFVTIDPQRARDHDDAVFAERRGAGFGLWVAIADVAEFVTAGSALDREARKRASSVYLPDRVVPMLPERLSGDLCSLRPDEERLALAVELAIDADGGVRRLRVAEARIRSRAKLAYEEAAAVMEGARTIDPVLADSLGALAALASVLRARRVASGSLDLELAEPEPVVDARGRVSAIGLASRSVAHRAIEEAMLAANRAIAELLVEARWPTLHRVHEPPDPAELAGLEPVLASLGLWPGRMRRAPGADDLPELVEAARERADAGVVHGLLVRALRQARYAEAPLGHFALAFDRYLHFTSPIRRYADLVVHRAVKGQLAGERPARAPLDELAEHLSRREREAAQAEYQALDWKRAALLLPRVGEAFEGRVSAIAPPGLFVTLEAVRGDGLVPARSLPRRAHLDLARAVVTLGRERIRLGDRVGVRLAGVDPARGRFHLALADYSEGAGSRRTARRSHSG
jgi:ribonuclease R